MTDKNNILNIVTYYYLIILYTLLTVSTKTAIRACIIGMYVSSNKRYFYFLLYTIYYINYNMLLPYQSHFHYLICLSLPRTFSFRKIKNNLATISQGNRIRNFRR